MNWFLPQSNDGKTFNIVNIVETAVMIIRGGWYEQD